MSANGRLRFCCGKLPKNGLLLRNSLIYEMRPLLMSSEKSSGQDIELERGVWLRRVGIPQLNSVGKNRARRRLFIQLAERLMIPDQKRELAGTWCVEVGRCSLQSGEDKGGQAGLEFSFSQGWLQRAWSVKLDWYSQPRRLAPEAAALARALDGFSWTAPDLHFLVKARAFELLRWLFQAAEKSKQPKAGPHPILLRVSQRLRERLCEPLRLQELAKSVGCSPHHLSRLFSKAAGETLSAHLRGLRLERARELIEGGTSNVSEAAMEVGYSSLSHFSREFQRYFGRAPASFIPQRRAGGNVLKLAAAKPRDSI